jgi:DeoR/GlpR family transcriptional regulator of sugar metabolism
MLTAERRQRIAELIQQQDIVQVRDLCTRFGASESTIRRDLVFLEQQGVLERSYGGATAVGQTVARLLPAGELIGVQEMRIGAAAAETIGAGETVFLGPGRVPLAVAQHIANRSNVTVVTNALDVASYLAAHAEQNVIVTGGQIDRRTNALLGHLAEMTLRELRADRAVIGVHGIQLPDGFTAESLAGAQFLRTVIEVMPRVTVVATAEQWARVGPAFLAPLEAVDTIVTSLNAPPAMVWDLTQLGIDIIQT